MAMSVSGNLSTPTPTNGVTSQSTQRSWLRCLNGPFYPKKRYIIGNVKAMTTVLRISNCGLVAGNRRVQESAIS